MLKRLTGGPAICIVFLMIVLIFSGPSLVAQEQTAPAPKSGSIKGRVIDAEIKSGIPQAKIAVKGTALKAASDSSGGFILPDVPFGTYTLEISGPHYLARDLADVVVKSGRVTSLEVELKLEPLNPEQKEITVTAKYFAAAAHESVSTTDFSYEEIRRAAGAAGDVSRVIGSLPSIAQTNDQVNSLVVRGGSPAENAFYIDNIEVPNINHYPVLGSTAGAIGLLNVDFIRDVKFSAGGFPALYGDRLSSVMDVSFREGDREALDLQFELSMMGAGIVAEGPIVRDKGSWMLSARRSYIDLLIGLLGQGVPVHWSDYQGKANYEFAPGNRLTLLGIGGVDDSGTQKADALKDGESFYGGLDTTEYTAGLNWFAMWGGRGYSNTSVSQSFSRYKDDAFHTESEELARRGNNSERAWRLRNINAYRFSDSLKVQFGLELKHLITDYDNFLAASTDVLGNPAPSVSRQTRVKADKHGAFVSWSWSPLRRLTFDLGLRVDHFSYNSQTHLSPRLALSLEVSPRTSFLASAGAFYQPLPLRLLVQNDAFKRLRDPRAYHYVLGLRRLLSDSTQLTVEGYLKDYGRFPLDPLQPSLFIFDELFYSGTIAEHVALEDTGRARSYGVEVMVQKKLADRIYGLVSGAYFRTQYRDLMGVWRNRVYDNRYIFSVEGGWRMSPTWEFALKIAYAGGAPYTPFDLEASRAANSGIFDPGRINAARLPAYFSLNLRVDKRFNFRASNLIAYLSVWNVSGHRNVMAYTWNTITLEPGTTLGWGILPVLGIEFEF